jgi:hypothetical protein
MKRGFGFQCMRHKCTLLLAPRKLDAMEFRIHTKSQIVG